MYEFLTSFLHTFIHSFAHCMNAYEVPPEPCPVSSIGDVKETEIDMISGSSYLSGDEKGKHHTLTRLVVATLPSASKESIKQGDLSWTGHREGFPEKWHLS